MLFFVDVSEKSPEYPVVDSHSYVVPETELQRFGRGPPSRESLSNPNIYILQPGS